MAIVYQKIIQGSQFSDRFLITPSSAREWNHECLIHVCSLCSPAPRIFLVSSAFIHHSVQQETRRMKLEANEPDLSRSR